MEPWNNAFEVQCSNILLFHYSNLPFAPLFHVPVLPSQIPKT